MEEEEKGGRHAVVFMSTGKRLARSSSACVLDTRARRSGCAGGAQDSVKKGTHVRLSNEGECAHKTQAAHLTLTLRSPSSRGGSVEHVNISRRPKLRGSSKTKYETM